MLPVLPESPWSCTLRNKRTTVLRFHYDYPLPFRMAATSTGPGWLRGLTAVLLVRLQPYKCTVQLYVQYISYATLVSCLAFLGTVLIQTCNLSYFLHELNLRRRNIYPKKCVTFGNTKFTTAQRKWQNIIKIIKIHKFFTKNT